MAAVFRAAGTYLGGQYTGTLTPPAGTVAGDLLIVCVASQGGAGAMVATGGQTWTTIANANSTSNTIVYWAIHNGTLGTVSAGGTGSYSAVMLAFTTGTFDTTTPIDVSNTAVVVAATSMSIGTVTTTVDNTVLVSVAGGNNDNNAGGQPFVTPTGWTYLGGGATPSGTDSCILVSSLAQPTAGTSPAANVTQAAAYAALRGVLFAIRPLVKFFAVNGTMTSLNGTVVASAATGVDAFFSVAGSMTALNGTVAISASRPRQHRPRREYLWMRDIDGEPRGVIR